MPVCLPWKKTDPKIDSIDENSLLTITGWGKITNDNRKSLKAYEDYSVATRTLRKVEIPITIPGTPASTKCKTNDNEIQFCAGGIKGMGKFNLLLSLFYIKYH